ncbi:MAG TPA: hypothetical protein PKM88_12645, partial [bacterium]|nr:hypothetical protein [bacterium]
LAVASVVSGLLGQAMGQRLIYATNWFALLFAGAAAGGAVALWRRRTPATLCMYGGAVLIVLAGGMARSGEQGMCLLRPEQRTATVMCADRTVLALPCTLQLLQYTAGDTSSSPRAVILATNDGRQSRHTITLNHPANIGNWQFTLTGTEHGDGVLCRAGRNPGYPVFVAGGLLLLAGTVLFGWRRAL